jgi:acetolactate synthase I/II/III large subunit
VDCTEDFEPALRVALAAGKPTLLHLRLSTDVPTSRITLTAIRDAVRMRLGQ